MCIRDRGYTGHGAANGREGLAVAAAQPISLAIVDVMMPVMDLSLIHICAARPGMAASAASMSARRGLVRGWGGVKMVQQSS